MSNYWDRYGRAVSPCHRLPPLLKLLMTLSAIILGIVIPLENWPAHGVLGCVIFAGHSIAQIPVSYLTKRLSLFLPFLGLMAISLPLSQGLQRGWETSATMMARGTLAFLASLWLVNVMPFEQLLMTLRRIGVPSLVVAILAFMYRYIFVVWDELDKLRTAQRSRCFGRATLWFRWKTQAQLIGMLLIRSLGRAERIHGSMRARGWNGEVHWLE